MVEMMTHETMMREPRSPQDPRVMLGLSGRSPQVDRLRTRWLRRFAALAARTSPAWAARRDGR
ncbi:MAG: hypothetical protein AMXMBFR23_28570 [Chloroflexota bacterium]